MVKIKITLVDTAVLENVPTVDLARFYERKASSMDKQNKCVFSSKKRVGRERTNNEFVNMKHSLFLTVIVSRENL